MGSFSEVGLEPSECNTFNTNVPESGEQDVVAHGIEGCTQVEEDENIEGTSVSRGEEVKEDFDECSFFTVVRTKSRLKGFVKLVALEMAVNLFGYNAFKSF